MDKKCLFITDTDFNKKHLTGAHRRFQELVLGFAELSCQVTVIAYPCEWLHRDDIIFLPIIKKKNHKFSDHIAGISVMFHALNAYRRIIEYDYAVSFGPTISICYHTSGYRHIISLFREDLVGYQKAIGAGRAKQFYFQLQERAAVCASEKIIVQCRNDREALLNRNRKFCKNLEERVFVQTNNANASWMKLLDLPAGHENRSQVRLLFIGDFSNARKGHGILLPALARLIEDGCPMEAWIVGDGKEKVTYEEQYQAYPAIRFLGRVSNVPELLSSCDMEVVPSLIDSCPNTVLEALNAGIAVYGTNTGGIPDLLQDNSYLFEPNADSIYLFLKKKIEQKRYFKDAEEQKKLRYALTFSWPERIMNIITEQ